MWDRRSWTHGIHTLERQQTFGAWEWCSTPCWWVATPFKMWSLLPCSVKSAGVPSQSQRLCRPEPSLLCAACSESHPWRGWRPQTFCCTHGSTVAPMPLSASTLTLGTQLTKWCQTLRKEMKENVTEAGEAPVWTFICLCLLALSGISDCFQWLNTGEGWADSRFQDKVISITVCKSIFSPL